MKKIISGISALAIMATMAAPMSAFADTSINAQTEGKTGLFTVSYTATPATQVVPAYTITIPASINLNSTTRTATITAEDVSLDTNKQINVTLDSADYVNTGDTEFKAKNTKLDSTVTYTIGKGSETTGVAVGDIVAEFTTNGSQTLTFSTPTGATYAGTHTETLTFGISMKDTGSSTPSVNPSYSTLAAGDTVVFGGYDWYIIDKRENGVTLLMKTRPFVNKAYDSNAAYNNPGSATWATSTVRTYLNETFYNELKSYESFSDVTGGVYNATIVKTTVHTPANPSYGGSGGADTEDYIYLLSLQEANALDENIRTSGGFYWLRTPGYDNSYAALVTYAGVVDAGGSPTYSGQEVRPVLNLELN